VTGYRGFRNELPNFPLYLRRSHTLPPLEFAVVGAAFTWIILGTSAIKGWRLASIFVLPLALSAADTYWFTPWIMDDFEGGPPWSLYACTYATYSFITGGTLWWCRLQGVRFLRTANRAAENATVPLVDRTTSPA